MASTLVCPMLHTGVCCVCRAAHLWVALLCRGLQWTSHVVDSAMNSEAAGSPESFRVHGTVYHMFGPLQPPAEQSDSQSAQLYIHDTDHESDHRSQDAVTGGSCEWWELSGAGELAGTAHLERS